MDNKPNKRDVTRQKHIKEMVTLAEVNKRANHYRQGLVLIEKGVQF
jgi:hypothetical protein